MLEEKDIYNKLFCGEAKEILMQFPDNCIDCVITSPPYWNLRDYKSDKQLGLEKDYNLYIDRLCDIFDEIKRVLKNTGTCWVNLGDNYVDKTLMLIPFRFALNMIESGWYLRNVIIWHKPNSIPSSAVDRFCNDFEYILFFTKSRKYYFNMIYEPFAESMNSWVKYKHPPKKYKDMGPMSYNFIEKYRNKVLNGEVLGKHKRCVWTISKSNYPGPHYAVYPEKLVETPILAGCPENGVVLDPFVGSGTTCVVAKKMFRKYVGIDVNEDYIKLANERLEN